MAPGLTIPQSLLDSCPYLEWAMTLTLINLALTVVPFVVIGIAIRLWMKRKGVDLDEVQSQAGTNRRPRKLYLFGFWREEE
jgi:hypothetical protein